MNNFKRSSTGFTLIELMIGLALSTAIVLAITSIFINNSQGYRINIAQAQIQEAGRFAMELMAHDIRMTGTWGCGGNSLEPENINVDVTSESLSVGSFRNTLRPLPMISINGYYQQYQEPLMGHQFINGNWNNNTANNLGQILNGLVPHEGSDILTIRMGSTRTFDITPNTYNSNASGANVSFSSTAQAQDLDWNQPIFILNNQCNYAAVVAVNRANDGVISLTDPAIIPGPNYESGYIGQAISNTYFIAQSNINPDVNSLWLSRNGITEELVTGIQAMRIHYGEGVNRVEEYVRARQVGSNWNNVRAIRIQLIALGEPVNIAGNDQSHTLINYNDANTIIDLPDNRIGQSFNTTITIRNRIR